ncbi:MAG: hypothetical protein ACYTGC_09105, partial [Planctomycetota bacterium]
MSTPIPRRWPMLSVVTLAALLLAAAAGAQTPIDLERARAHFEQARRLSEADGGRLWGVELDGPMLFADRATRTVVANRPDPEGRMTERGGIYVGTLPADVLIANTATEWAGQEWTMVIWPLPRHRYRRGQLLMHECFHRVQHELGLPPGVSDCAHLETQDGRTWMRMEWRALSEALIREAEPRRRAVADVLLFRALRHELFPERVDDERALMINEGVCEYTGFRLSGLPPHVLADRVALQLDDYEQRTKFVRNFAYASGPAYGILLDEAGTEWRSSVTPQTDLGALLARAYGASVPTSRLHDTAMSRIARYEGELVVAEETRRAERYARQQAQFRSRFIDGPTLTLPMAGEFGYSFDPNEVAALEDVGTVYPTARVSDAWGVLTVESGGVLLVREDGLITSVVVPAPADPSARPLA